MGNYLTPGHEFIDGQQVSGPDLTEHVSEAVLKSTAISTQILKDPAALSDEVLINDGGTLKKTTLQLLKTLILGSGGIGSDQLATEARLPIGGVVDFAGATAPDGWLLCYGQAVSRASFAALFAAIGTTHGAGNGSSTFNLPDYRGRVGAGKDNMGGTSAARLNNSGLVGHGIASTTLGGSGGTQQHTMTVAELANHAHPHSHTTNHTHNTTFFHAAALGFPIHGLAHQSAQGVAAATCGIAMLYNGTVATGYMHWDATPSSTDGTTAGLNHGHNNCQPTIIINKIIRYL